MLSPDQLEAAGNSVAAVYNDIEARMLDHLVGALLSVDRLDQATVTELNLLAQSHTAQLRGYIEDRAEQIDGEVRATAERLLRASDEDDLKRVGEGSPMWPQQVTATVDGVARILARDNLQMIEGAKQAFLGASIEAVTRVNTGTMTTERALHSAVRKLEREGIPIITYQNSATATVTVRNKVDVAVRRHVRTQIAQDGARMTLERIEASDVTLVEVSSHEDSRPSHAGWQGRCYSLSGEQVVDGTRYPDFYQATRYGQVDGLLGANCRHSFGPYRHGAPRAYEPNPKHPSGLSGEEIYELEQTQRYLERRIREAKREVRGAQQVYERMGGLESRSALLKAQEKLKTSQGAMRDLIKEANAKAKPGTTVLTRKPNREWAGDMPKTTRKPAIMGRMRQEEPLVSLGGREQNGYSVSPSVNTRGYHAAFEKMPVPKPVAEGAYREAGRILERATGENEEFMAAIDAKTGARIVDNLGRAGTARHTYLNDEEMAAIESHRGNVVVIHNHPHSGAPSYGDVVTAARNDRIEGSVVVGHDGSVWFISASNPSIADKLERVYNAAKDALGDNAQLYALDSLIKRARKEGFVWKQLR